MKVTRTAGVGTLTAVQNKIILVMDEPEKKRGSIEIPDAAQEQMRRGTVIAVGPGKPVSGMVSYDENPVPCVRPGVKVGDILHVQDYHGGKVTTTRPLVDQAQKEWPAGTVLLIVDEDDVLMVER